MSAKIHHISKIFRLIKYAFVLITIITASVVLYYIMISQERKISHNKSLEIKQEMRGEPNVSFKAIAPDLTGISIDQGPYYIRAKEMQELSGHVSFIEPRAKLMLKHLDWLNLTSERAKLTVKDNHLQLLDNVKGNLNKHYYFQGKQVEIFPQEEVIKSYSYIRIFTDEYNLESKQGFLLDYEDETAFFNGKINVNIQRKKDKSNTNIKSDRLDIFWQKKIGHFLGNVILTKDGTKVEADKMTAILNKTTDQLDKVHAYGNVRITDKNQVATGEYGEYIVANSTLILKDKVTLTRDGSVLNGNLLNYNFNSKKADLVGDQKGENKRVRAVILPKKKHE